MSFLARRSAGAEGAYFLQESKHAVSRLLQNPKNQTLETHLTSSTKDAITAADMLPEVLKNSLPPQIFQSSSGNSKSSSFLRAGKWVLEPDPQNGRVSVVAADALNPLRAYVSLPQVTFGPKRWQLPTMENSVLASTANDLRHDKHAPINPDKLKAAAAGLSQIGSAFAVATVVVFGGFAVICGLAASKLEVHNANDIRSRGKDLVQPRFEMIKEGMTPLKTWAKDLAKKWHLEREESLKERALFKELSRVFDSKSAT